MTTTRECYHTLEQMLDAQLPQYLAGDRTALNDFFADISDVLTIAPEDTHLLSVLATIAVAYRDLPLIERIVRLHSGANFDEALLAAARYGSRHAYWTLRGAKKITRPIHGMTLALAWEVRDSSAYFPRGSIVERVLEAHRLLAEIDGSKDDAIEFLKLLGLTRWIDFALGITQEWPGF